VKTTLPVVPSDERNPLARIRKACQFLDLQTSRIGSKLCDGHLILRFLFHAIIAGIWFSEFILFPSLRGVGAKERRDRKKERKRERWSALILRYLAIKPLGEILRFSSENWICKLASARLSPVPTSRNLPNPTARNRNLFVRFHSKS